MLPFINAPFKPLSETTGASVDELKLLTCFLLSYPLAGVLKRLPDSQPWQKNAFIVGISLFYLVGVFDLWDGLRTLLYSSAATYTIAYYVDGSLMPWIGFIFLMGHMSISHIYRQIVYTPSVVDITGAQMVLVMKLSAFCWNVHDGRLPRDQLSESQKYAAVVEFPSILDFAGYVLFFPSLFVGPAFDYVEYRRWIETTMFDSPPGTDPSKAPPTRKRRKIPRSGRPAALKAALGLAWIFGFLKLSSVYNTSLLLGQGYMKYGFLRRVWILHMFGFAARLKYYGVWLLTEGACILTGMGYNGFDPKLGKVLWNRLENVNPWGLETAQSPHAYMDSWNKNTNHWLRNYVYLRVTPKGKKPGFRASAATFATSAVWHGFYPGYYLTFVLGALLQTAAKNFRRLVRPFFFTPDGSKSTTYKKYYDSMSWLTTQLVFSFVAAPFIIQNFADCITVWARVYFYGVVGIVGSMAFFASPAKSHLIRTLNKRNKVHNQRKAVEPQPIEAPILGLPNDPAQDIDEAMRELKEEIDAIKRRGIKASMQTVQESKFAVDQKLGREL